MSDWKEALQAISNGEELSPEIEHAIISAARLIKRRKKIGRKHEAQKTRDELRTQTGRVQQLDGPVETPPGDLPNHAHCYVCKRPYKTLHAFYHLLCVECGELSYARRTPDVNLQGRRAILTGGRTKIGYRTALMLLRAGATVTVTTRYAHDAARRYSEESDYGEFADRLRVERVDFRDVRAVHSFVDEELRRREPLDILINQAAQTIRASRALERFEKDRDRLTALQLKGKVDVDALALKSKGAIVKDPGHGEWVDNNARNSWDLALEDVSLAEFFEVQLVNVFAPWALSARLQPLMRTSSFKDRYVIQVSAIEGQFERGGKSGKHPHTNMAKAALHMLVRTSAEPLARSGIYMNAVDPGWVSDQSAILRRNPNRPAFTPPLDTIDGAARLIDPIVQGSMKGHFIYGQFLKDFFPGSW